MPHGDFITYKSNNVKSKATEVTEATLTCYNIENDKMKVEPTGAT